MATASKDKTIRLWNMSRLNETSTVMSDHDWVWNIAFSPDDNQLMAGIHSVRENIKDVDFTIHAWPTKILSMSSRLCSKITRNMTQEEWWNSVGKDLPYESTCRVYHLIINSR